MVNKIKYFFLFFILLCFMFAFPMMVYSYTHDVTSRENVKSISQKKADKKKKRKRKATSRKVPSKADKIGAGEHPPALSDLPLDKFGLVNWVEATKQGKVSPVVSIDPDRLNRFYEGLIIYNATSPTRGDVIFPHDVHTYFLDCDSCHPKPFNKTIGKAPILMIRIKRGRFCGKCHGKIAFPIENCDRCHVLPKANIKW